MPIGELAALATAATFAASAVVFEQAGKRIGSMAVGFIRVLVALVLLSLANAWARGLFWPSDASAHAWLWLGLSGVVGLTLGDICLFRAFVLLGARLAVLVMMLVPPLTALMGWLLLGEGLTGMDILAMAATVGGVTAVVTERSPATSEEQAKHLWVGVGLAFLGAIGQSAGLILSKYGMGDYSALAATEIRMIFGLIAYAVVFSLIGWWPRIRMASQHRQGVAFASMGALVGPFIGVTLSLYAVQHTKAGIAASIMATAPLLLIPVHALMYNERVSLRSVLGTLVALGGVALLFL